MFSPAARDQLTRGSADSPCRIFCSFVRFPGAKEETCSGSRRTSGCIPTRRMWATAEGWKMCRSLTCHNCGRGKALGHQSIEFTRLLCARCEKFASYFTGTSSASYTTPRAPSSASEGQPDGGVRFQLHGVRLEADVGGSSQYGGAHARDGCQDRFAVDSVGGESLCRCSVDDVGPRRRVRDDGGALVDTGGVRGIIGGVQDPVARGHNGGAKRGT